MHPFIQGLARLAQESPGRWIEREHAGQAFEARYEASGWDWRLDGQPVGLAAVKAACDRRPAKRRRTPDEVAQAPMKRGRKPGQRDSSPRRPRGTFSRRLGLAEAWAAAERMRQADTAAAAAAAAGDTAAT